MGSRRGGGCVCDMMGYVAMRLAAAGQLTNATSLGRMDGAAGVAARGFSLSQGKPTGYEGSPGWGQGHARWHAMQPRSSTHATPIKPSSTGRPAAQAVPDSGRLGAGLLPVAQAHNMDGCKRQHQCFTCSGSPTRHQPQPTCTRSLSDQLAPHVSAECPGPVAGGTLPSTNTITA